MRTFFLRHFCEHLLRKFPCVSDSLSVGAVWALAPGLEHAEYAFLFWMQEGVPGQFRMSPGMRWYTAVGLHTMQGISDKLRELTHYDHGASAVNQALHGIQDALQCTVLHRCQFEDNSLVWVIPTGTPHVEPATIGCDDEIAARAGADCAAEVSTVFGNPQILCALLY